MRSTHVRRVLRASRSRVYRALTDPKEIARWRMPDGMTVEIHEFEAREEGSFRVSLTYDAPTATGETSVGKTGARTDTYHGHFVRLVPDEEVVEAMEFESAKPDMQGEMTIRYQLRDAHDAHDAADAADAADAEGSEAMATELVAVHEGVPPGVKLEDNETGWRMALDKLAALVEAS